MTDTDMLIAQRNALAKVVALCWEEAREGRGISSVAFQILLINASLITLSVATAKDANAFDCNEGAMVYRISSLFADTLKAAKP
jgi:hypothetical protein